MAKTLTTLFRSNFFKSPCLNKYLKYGLSPILPVRSIYSSTSLGLDGYIQTRERVKEQFSHLSEKFRVKMNEYISDEQNKSMIFTEDLKNMIHLVEPNKSDVELVIKMMKKFNLQNQELRFGSFVFGPVVMRMFYFLNEPDLALQCFNSPELSGFFDQLMSFQLLMDMLYENKRYDDIFKTFEVIKSKQLQGMKYPKNVVCIVFATCYKQNTPESLKFALNLWKELNEVGHLPMRKAATFCAALALNQGKTETALEIIGNIKKQNYMTVRNLKVAALTQIGRLDEVLVVLKSVLEIDDPNNIKHSFSKDVIEQVKNAVEKQNNPTITNDFLRIEKHLQDGHISDTTLESQLTAEIVKPPDASRNNRKIIPRYQYSDNRQTQNNYRVNNRRPGLRDIN